MRPTSPTIQGAGQIKAKLGGVLRRLASDRHHRSSYVLILNSVLIAGTGFLFWMLAARRLDASDVGIATSIISSVVFVSSIARVGMDITLLRMLPDRKLADPEVMVNTALTVTGLLAALVAVVFIAGTVIWSPALAVILTRPLAAVSFTVLSVLWTLSLMGDAIFTGTRRGDLVLRKNLLHALTRVALLVPLIFVLHAWGIVLAFVGTAALILPFALYVWLPPLQAGHVPRPQISWPYLRGAAAASVANYAVTLALAAPISVGSLLVFARFGPADAAVFYVLWMVGSLAMIAPASFGQSSLVEMSYSADTKMRISAKAYLVCAAGAVGAMTVALLVLPLFGREYAVGARPLIPFALASIPALLFYVELSRARASGKTGVTLAMSGVAVGLFLALISLPVARTIDVGWYWLVAVTLASGAGFALGAGRTPRSQAGEPLPDQ